ncbi:MAG: ABC transporter permease [Actinomycetota bacterium]|nr:ABC transporter permease [Actinomycetota bacterium]
MSTPFVALAAAILRGFLRDKASLFFAVVFPLMFLVLFGAVFDDTTADKIELIEVGEVSLLDDLPDEAQAGFVDAFEVAKGDDLGAAIGEVRAGDADVAIEQQDQSVIAHYTETDQVAAAQTLGTLNAFVDGANVAASGQPPRFQLSVEPVEDESLANIDFVTPGLLGWAVAMSAAFGAAATLQGWRQTKLLRRLQLAPVRTRTIVGARVVTTLLVAFGQTAIFLGLGSAAFGLNLSGSWPMAIPLVAAGALCFMALGLLAGAVTKTTEGAVNMANFLVLPMAFLSGSFFPLEGAPDWLQVISKALPLRHMNDAMLDVMVRGQGPSAAFPTLGLLLAFAVVMTLVAARLFRWETT